MIYLCVINGRVESFGDISTMKNMTGRSTADMVITEEAWESAGNTAYLNNGEITLSSNEEALFRKLRYRRNDLLSATDYLVLPDYPLPEEKKEAVKKYRQDLRELPSRQGAPWDGGEEKTPWPVKPQL